MEPKIGCQHGCVHYSERCEACTIVALKADIARLRSTLEKIAGQKCEDPTCRKSGCAAEAQMWAQEVLKTPSVQERK